MISESRGMRKRAAAQKRLDGAAKQSRGLAKRWRKIDADLDSGRAELEPMLSEAVEYRSEALKAFADSIFEMREQVAAEEWAALYRDVKHGG